MSLYIPPARLPLPSSSSPLTSAALCCAAICPMDAEADRSRFAARTQRKKTGSSWDEFPDLQRHTHESAMVVEFDDEIEPFSRVRVGTAHGPRASSRASCARPPRRCASLCVCARVRPGAPWVHACVRAPHEPVAAQELDLTFDNVIVVDNLPIVPPEKVDKLVGMRSRPGLAPRPAAPARASGESSSSIQSR